MKSGSRVTAPRDKNRKGRKLEEESRRVSERGGYLLDITNLIDGTFGVCINHQWGIVALGPQATTSGF
jgi:hypothetical protein